MKEDDGYRSDWENIKQLQTGILQVSWRPLFSSAALHDQISLSKLKEINATIELKNKTTA